MSKYSIGIMMAMAMFLMAGQVFAATPALVITPAQIMQGDPFMVKIENVTNINDIKKVTFDGKNIGVLSYQGMPTALVAVDLQKQPGNYDVAVTMTDGTVLQQSVTVSLKEKIEKPLGIPAKLGGNTTASQKNLIKELAKEQGFFGHVTTAAHALWARPFIYPLTNPIVTDQYGYTRQTGAYLIAHKGTDFAAAEGTPIMAMNDGIVRVVKKSITYGNTVVIDHGQGLMTYYLHLSKFNVKVGQTVQQGQIIGLSGQTGYALGPHLHLTIRVNNISIDPVQFMNLFQ